jgi:phosphocarrier protein
LNTPKKLEIKSRQNGNSAKKSSHRSLNNHAPASDTEAARIRSLVFRARRFTFVMPQKQSAVSKVWRSDPGHGKKHCVEFRGCFSISHRGDEGARFAMSQQRVSKADNTNDASDTAVTRTVKIINSLGLHARPAALFVQTANRFPDCRIMVSNGQESVNGKSIMGMMTLAAAQGTDLFIEIIGDQAREAMDALSHLIAGKFDEE